MPDAGKVLIIDDEPQIVRGLTLRLRAAGYEVATASDGAAGLPAATAAKPDVILLDLQMPGMDGFEALRSLRNGVDTRTIPVTVLSASAVESARARAMALGARCFLNKPFRTDRLRSTIQEMRAPSGDSPPESTPR